MPFRPSQKDLETIRRIVANESLTRTAEEMHVTQPAISQRVTNLEANLDLPLFTRRDGRLAATAAAERLAVAADTVQRTIDAALADARAIDAAEQRQLRITTQCHTSYRWLSFVIRDLAAMHPAVNIDVVPEAAEDPYGALDRGEVDLALVYAGDGDRGRSTRRLFDDELFAVMADEHPLAGRRYLNPANFADQALVLYTGRRHAFVEQVLAPAGVSPARLLQVRMTEAIVELARVGQGIAVLAGWVLNDLVSRRGLAAVRIGRGGYRRTWRAVVRDDPDRGPYGAFCDSVVRTAALFDDVNWRGTLERRAAKSSPRSR